MKIIFAESHNLDRPDPLGSHHYIRLFREAGHDCLWLGPAISPMHIGKPDHLNRHRYRIWREDGRMVDGIQWLVPLTLLFYYHKPFLRSLYAGRKQYHFCLPPLAGQLRKIGFSQVDLIWCAGPAALSLLDIIPHRLSCYRLADRLDQFAMIPPNVGVIQQELIEKVDFVLATSLALQEWAEESSRREVYYMPNGVSDEFFTANLQMPDDFPADGRPVALYLGTMDTRFDLETLAAAVRQMPEVHFLLIGPLTCDSLREGMSALQEKENFSLLGPREYSQAPAYLQHASVGLIPFHDNKLTAAVNPIKYYEYLACGLPVVAPPLRELKAMGGPLQAYRAGDGGDFCRAIREALAEKEKKGRAVRKERIDFATGQTWRARFRSIMEILEKKGLKDNNL
ncbi:MAG: glycosyltransferase [Bacillota bacterium]|nr:glycosyltransferase [Bacillota bacterium]